MDVIEAEFNSYFANWDILLPQSAIAAGRRGKIVADGWTIWFLFGVEGEREFLDFYAMHRMTNDRHLRLYSDGSGEGLRTLAQGIQYPRGATAEDEARIQKDQYERNRGIAEMLERKGFGIEGDEHMSAQLLRFMQTTPLEERPERGEPS